MRAHGHVFKYGDNVDTDVIIPARYLNSFDAQELASHAMADIDPDFVKKVQSGDIIVANKNFGCGSSREHAPLCLKTAGVSCIIAETFARIFYRNAINIGLPIIECPEAAKGIDAGDDVEVLAKYTSNYYAGRPALIRTNTQQGYTLHFGGTFTRQNVTEFLTYTGVIDPWKELIELPADCEIAVREKNDAKYIFVLNYSSEKQNITLKTRMTDLYTTAESEGEVALEPYETKVYQI